MSRMLSKMNLWVRSKRKNYLMNISNLKSKNIMVIIVLKQK